MFWVHPMTTSLLCTMIGGHSQLLVSPLLPSEMAALMDSVVKTQLHMISRIYENTTAKGYFDQNAFNMCMGKWAEIVYSIVLPLMTLTLLWVYCLNHIRLYKILSYHSHNLCFVTLLILWFIHMYISMCLYIIIHDLSALYIFFY